MNEVTTQFDREAKIILLNALKRGRFEQTDIDVLAQKGYIDKMKLEIEIIDKRAISHENTD